MTAVYRIAIPRGDDLIAMLHAGVSGTWGRPLGSGKVAGICGGVGLSEVVAADLSSTIQNHSLVAVLSLLPQ